MNEIASRIETLDLSQVRLGPEYRTGQADLIYDFYRPCLLNSNRYDRAVGYFRSTVFLLVSDAVLRFVKHEGHIRLICSPSLNAKDVEAIEAGYKSREEVALEALDQEIEFLLHSSDLVDRTRILATMIALKAMDVKLAIRPNETGIYHEKLGIFKDLRGHIVSFKGSSNETWNGWHAEGNYESIEVFCSWHDKDVDRARRHADYFEKLWENKIDDIRTVEFPEAVLNKLYRIASDNLEDIPLSLIAPTKKKRQPLPHQLSALENWKAQNCRGILQHATGSGKTYTSLVAIKEHLLMRGNTSLILVPSRLLLQQWEKEIAQEIPEATVLKAGDSNNSWKKDRRLQDFSIFDECLKPRIVLATMQTAATMEFRRRIASGQHLLLVADEVHQIGSTENLKIFEIDAGKRLGLSATPSRFGDPIGTQKIINYFGPIVQPIFTLENAISSGRLVNYEYSPHPIYLTVEEADRWRTISRKISKEIAKTNSGNKGDLILSNKVKLLLIQRSRIAKKANGKVMLALSLITRHFQDDQKWLIYCEDQDQLSQVLAELNSKGFHVNEYHTSMQSDQSSTLKWFQKFGGILVSIRCLDEGIDIPDVSHALILASSQNPRQFIQRRGRVLRKAPHKNIAFIHDAIVVPVDAEDDKEQLTLLRNEMCRAIEFASGAINKSSGAELRDIAAKLRLDIAFFANQGSEEEVL